MMRSFCNLKRFIDTDFTFFPTQEIIDLVCCNLLGWDSFFRENELQKQNPVQDLSIIHSYLASNLRVLCLLYGCKPKKGELQYEKY